MPCDRLLLSECPQTCSLCVLSGLKGPCRPSDCLCRVQFDRRELGVELIRDVDVMPCNPTHNLPVSMLSQNPHLVRARL